MGKSRRKSRPVGGRLTPRQEAFVREYLVDLNGKAAAIRAGYKASNAENTASALLSYPQVSTAIEAGKAKQVAKAELEAVEILRELRRIATCDVGKAFDGEGRLLKLHEMPEDVRRAIAGLEVEELWGEDDDGRAPIGNVRKVKFWDKNTAISNAMKHLGLLKDVIKHEGLSLEALVLASMGGDG